jgi:3-oxoadipate enol-lactonase
MHLHANGIKIHYVIEGPENAPVVTFSHSLGSSMDLWETQANLLKDRFRVLRYDNRGHGGTEVSPGGYSFELFAEDAYALLQGLGIEKTHFVGLSNGGMIAQTLALMHPDCVRSLVLCDTTSRPPFATIPIWEERAVTALSEGMASIVPTTIERWFNSEVRKSDPALISHFAKLIRTTSPEAYAACCRAIQKVNLTDSLHKIDVPTLLLVGSEDVGTVIKEHEIIRDRIPGSELIVFEGAAHLSNLCVPGAFNEALMAFLDQNAKA